jgi:uncharacterized membrane protein
MAYALLPPAGGVLLLIMEHKSDYVRFVDPLRGSFLEEAEADGRVRCIRFHAWQSSLLFAFIVVCSRIPQEMGWS